MNPTGLHNSEEKHLLNEIAHLTNLLESSKRQTARPIRGPWLKKVEKCAPYNFTQASMMKKVNNYSLRKLPSSLLPVGVSANIVEKNTTIPQVPSSSSGATAASEKIAPLQVDQQKVVDPPQQQRKRYYAIELNSDTVVQKAVVERRLPPDVVEIPRKTIKNESNDNNNCQSAEDSTDCASKSSSAVQVSKGQNVNDGVTQCLSVDVVSSVAVKDEGYQLRRSRLLSRLSKLTSHKERVKGQSCSTSSSLPAYLPC